MDGGDEVKFGISYQPLSNTISIGRLNKANDRYLEHEDHTERALAAVAEYHLAADPAYRMTSESGYVEYTLYPYPDEAHATVLQEIQQLIDGLTEVLDKAEQKRQMYARFGDDKP